MLQYDFEQSVGYWMTMATQSIRRALTVRLAEEQITLRQWEVLAWLATNPELSQNQLAECMGIEPPTLAGVVTRMERDGWIIKSNCEDDRRRCRLTPTPKAEEIWLRALSLCLQVRETALVGLPQEDLETLRRVCSQIRDNLAAVAPELTPSPEDCPDTDAVRREMTVLRAM